MNGAPCAFVAAYVNHSTCELFANAKGNIVAHIPTKATCEATLELGTDSFVTAEIVCRAMGIARKHRRWQLTHPNP